MASPIPRNEEWARGIADEWISGLRSGDPRAIEAMERLIMGIGRTPEITDRQLDTLVLAASGATYAEIGRALWVSAETVKVTLARCRAVLEARTTTQAVATAIRKGLI